jgi:hypothetical protein
MRLAPLRTRHRLHKTALRPRAQLSGQRANAFDAVPATRAHGRAVRSFCHRVRRAGSACV